MYHFFAHFCVRVVTIKVFQEGKPFTVVIARVGALPLIQGNGGVDNAMLYEMCPEVDMGRRSNLAFLDLTWNISGRTEEID